ncbi:hypothetical protein [Alcanivorax sp. NBRC 102028]|jgi:hypothetical protein|uniref:hypothetical protein n=1 Tax=Alcanivorax sp. NBRC 102028 TaxID=1113897 RepID=UPI000789C396|nr:hypothetical protein [Alcanivorax sp. NBRC 102028]
MVRDILSIAGSIASITGVSLLWVRELLPEDASMLTLAYMLAAALVAASFSVGACAGLLKIFMDLEEAFSANAPGRIVKFTYWGLAGPFLVGILIICLALIWDTAFSFFG